MRIAVVTDSTAYMPPEVARQFGITVVPLMVHFEDGSYRDGVDMDAATFYTRLVTEKNLPTTSQPPVGDFVRTFTDLCARHDGVVAVMMSSKISGTYQAAYLAAEMVNPSRIRVVDTELTVMSLGFAVMSAAVAANANRSLDEVEAEARRVAKLGRLLFVVDDLSYLHRGGRLSRAETAIGSALSIKPVLAFRDGEIVPYRKVRSYQRAVTAAVDELVADSGRGRLHLAILHTNAPDRAAELQREITNRVKPSEMVVSNVGPVVGTHTGPGCVGVSYYVD